MKESVENEQLPQNLKDLLKDVGENAAIVMLHCLGKRDWRISKNIDGPGYDVLLTNEKLNKIIKLEVKTLQKLICSPKSKNTLHITLSENEIKNADFVICLWFEKLDFFIVPISAFKKEKVNYKWVVGINKNNTYRENSLEFLNNWESIFTPIKKTSKTK